MIRKRDGLRMSDRFRIEGRQRPLDEEEAEAAWGEAAFRAYDDEDEDEDEHDDEPSREPMKRQTWAHETEDSPRRRPPRQRRAEA